MKKILTIITLSLILTLGNIFPGIFASASAYSGYESAADFATDDDAPAFGIANKAVTDSASSMADPATTPNSSALINTTNADPQGIPQIPREFYRAKVIEVLEEGKTEIAGIPQPYQKIIIELLTGPEKSQKFEIIYGDFFAIQESQKVKKGEIVVVGRTAIETGPENPSTAPNYFITEKYRIPGLAWAIIIFLAIAITFGRKNAFFAIIGLAVTAAILIKIVMPLMIKGVNPLTATLMGSLLITIFSLYLGHGFRKRTTIAAFSMVITIGIAVGLAEFFATLAKLSGAATEDVYFLQSGPFAGLDLKGLLLSGMIFGALGVLDDVATAQSAAVEELKKANPSLTFSRLYHHGMEIGREHISSLINTLFLAYAGAGLPLMFMLATPMDGASLWITLNNEILAEEIVRTLVGSAALVFAVPITTFLSAKFYAQQK